jgi:hypothetical protein
MHLVTLEILALSLGVTASSVAFNNQSSRNPYQPYPVSCPSGDLVRHADSINLEEQAYAQSRYSKASHALRQWLDQAWNLESVPGYGTQLPTLALALSGGGPKAGIITAGALYGLDDREDSQSVVAGLLQSMTYISALSGGSLTLSGVIANDFAKVSTLKKLFYDSSYQNLFAGVLAQVSTLVSITKSTVKIYLTTLLLSKQTQGTRPLLDIRRLYWMLMHGAPGSTSSVYPLLAATTYCGRLLWSSRAFCSTTSPIRYSP